MIFDNLNTGLNPRPYPLPAIASGCYAGLRALLFASTVLGTTWYLQASWETFGSIVPPGSWLRNLSASEFEGSLIARTLLAGGIGILVGALSGKRVWRDTPRTEPFLQPNEADPRIFRDEQAEEMLRKAFSLEALPNAESGIAIAPHIIIPRVLESRNTMILGASGSGKSNICRAYAQQAIERGDLVVLHCTKGDVTRSFRMKDIVLISPAHRNGWAWDIGMDIDGPAAAAEFSAVVIPASEQPFFSDTARLVLTDVILAVIAKHGRDWGARELLQIVLTARDELCARIEQIDLSASPLLQGGDADGMSKTVDSILTTMISGALKTLRPMAYAWSSHPASRRFSVKRAFSSDWKGPRILIVQSHPEFEALSTAVCGGLLRRVCQAVASPQPGGNRPRVTMVLDEFYSLGRIDGIDRSLSVAREHGMATTIALQSLQQLKNAYGDTAELIFDLFQIKIYGRQVAGEATERAVRDLGKRQITGKKKNLNPAPGDTRRHVTLEQDLPIFSSTQLGRDLGLFNPDTPDEVIRAILHYAGTAYLIDWPPTRWKSRGRGFVPADWTQEVPLRSR